MDKYERRRQRLDQIRASRFEGSIVKLAQAIGKAPSYVGRMLYEEGKAGGKRIGEDVAREIEQALHLPPLSLDAEDEAPPAPDLGALALSALNDLSEREIEAAIATLEAVLAAKKQLKGGARLVRSDGKRAKRFEEAPAEVAEPSDYGYPPLPKAKAQRKRAS